jgi:hypothetical protein
MYVVVNKLPLVGGIVSPVEFSEAIFFAIFVFTLVACPIGPCLLPVTMLLILTPVPLIACPIRVIVLSKSMSFIIFPFPFIDIPVRVYQSSTSISLIIFPVALIKRAICPHLHTLAVSHIAVYVPLALISCTILQCDHSFALSFNIISVLRVGLVVEVSKLLSYRLDELVVVIGLLIVSDKIEVADRLHLKSVDLPHVAAGQYTAKDRLNFDNFAHYMFFGELLIILTSDHTIVLVGNSLL